MQIFISLEPALRSHKSEICEMAEDTRAGMLATSCNHALYLIKSTAFASTYNHRDDSMTLGRSFRNATDSQPT